MFEEWKRRREYRLRCYKDADELERQTYALLACRQLSSEWFDIRLAVAAILRELPDMSVREGERAQALIAEKIKSLKKIR